MKLNRTIKIFINYLLGPLLFAWLSWSIYRQITRQPDLDHAWQQISVSLHSSHLWYLVAVIVLMGCNWSLEAFKWKLAVAPVQEVSFGRALRAVLSGVSFSVSTPNRVGEYFGRVLYMDEGKRLKTISITIVSSISQLLVTLVMGGIGLIILRSDIEAKNLISGPWLQVIIYGVFAVLLVLTLFYFRLAWLIRLLNRVPGSRRFAYLVNALGDFDATLLWRLLSLSAVRFAVFSCQYYLLFQLFTVDSTAWQLLWTVSVSFLVMAVIPSIAITELVQRGKVMTTVVGIFSANGLGINLAVAGIWFINLIIPAIVGSLLILSIKRIISNKNKDE